MQGQEVTFLLPAVLISEARYHGFPFTRVAILVPSASLCYGQFSILQTLSLSSFSLFLFPHVVRSLFLCFVLTRSPSFRSFCRPLRCPFFYLPFYSCLPRFFSRLGQATYFSFLQNRKWGPMNGISLRPKYFTVLWTRIYRRLFGRSSYPCYFKPSCLLPHPARQIRKNVHANLILPLTLTLRP